MKRNIKSKRIILELLHKPDGSLTKYKISKETETNISWVIHFIRKLEKKKLTKNTQVINYDKLVDFYIELSNKRKFFEFQITEPLKYLKTVKESYILTTYSAENLISHHLFPSRTDIYVKRKDIEKWKKNLFKKGLIGKGNLKLIIVEDDYIFKFIHKIKKLKVVTVPLLLIDLKKEGGVCLQAYEYLIKNVQK